MRHRIAQDAVSSEIKKISYQQVFQEVKKEHEYLLLAQIFSPTSNPKKDFSLKQAVNPGGVIGAALPISST